MTQISEFHSSIIKLLADFALKAKDDAINKLLTTEPEEKLARKIFLSFRNDEQHNSKGLRLTKFGVELMKRYFKYSEIPVTSKDETLKVKILLYLDRVAKMPYYIGGTGKSSLSKTNKPIKINEFYILFETELAIKMKLAEGNLEIFVE